MSQEFLDRAEIGTALQQVGCEGMAQRVRVGVGQRRLLTGGQPRPGAQSPTHVGG